MERMAVTVGRPGNLTQHLGTWAELENWIMYCKQCGEVVVLSI